MKPNSCKHFNGFGLKDDKQCEAGLCYRSLVPSNDGIVFRLPCTGNEPDSRFPRVECPKYETVTAEDIKQRQEALDAAVKRMKAISPWASKQKAKAVRGTDLHGEDDCPVGCGGRIHFSISGYNGHMHAACTTRDCIRFME